jgi:hypothetical protein
VVTKIRAKRGAPQLNFDVTREQIATAIPRDSGHCMIADALAAAIPQARFISVDLATIRFTDLAAGWRYIYLTPYVAQQALLAFDQGDEVQPFRIRTSAAQMVATGTARRARTAPGEPESGEPPKRKRQRARLADHRGGGSVSTKVGGNAPPVGPLARTIGTDGGSGRQPRTTGKRRAFGLRTYVR